MKTEKVIDQISNVGWFKGIEDDKVRRIIDHSKIKKYKAGEFVYMVGDRQTNVFCVIDGQVKVSINGKDGEEFVLAIWETGHWFGEGSLYEDSTMPLEASVINDATILAVPMFAIEKVLGDGATFYLNVLHDVIGRTRLLFKLVEILIFKPLHARVAARMLHLIDMFGQESSEGILLPMKISQSEFARMSGGSRQRVNQVFRKWSDEGIVSKQEKYYVVHDLEALAAESEASED